MCVYGIGLPFDHPIWQNLPPCRCGGPLVYPSSTLLSPLFTYTTITTSTTTKPKKKRKHR